MREWLLANWSNLVGVGGFLLAVVGLYLTFYPRKRKRPIFAMRSTNVFKGLANTVPDVEVKFPGYGTPIKALTITKIAFWNAGSDTIKKQDVVKEDPINVRAKEGIVFLTAATTDSVNPLNKIECTVSKDRTSVAISFDYLDSYQGGIIQVFHTGISNEDLTIHGTIMGSSPIKRKPVTTSQAERVPPWIVFCLLGILWCCWGLVATGIIDVPPAPPEPLPVVPGIRIPIELMGIIIGCLTLLSLLAMHYSHIPKPLSKIRWD